jgi:hypothetical protein
LAGTLFAAPRYDEPVRLWNVQTEEVVFERSLIRVVKGASFSPERNYVGWGVDHGTWLFMVSSGEAIAFVEERPGHAQLDLCRLGNMGLPVHVCAGWVPLWDPG